MVFVRGVRIPARAIANTIYKTASWSRRNRKVFFLILDEEENFDMKIKRCDVFIAVGKHWELYPFL